MNKIIKCNDLNITIYIEDTDFQGFVYHANYLKFFERARSDFLSSNKISQKTLRINNLAFVVKKINLNYVSAAELGDDLIIKTSVEKKSDIETLEDNRVTVRDKDTMKQERVSTDSLSDYYKSYFN